MKLETASQSNISQMNVDTTENNSNSNGKILEIEKVNETFTIVKVNENDEEKTFIAVGNNRITELQSYAKSLEQIAEKDWTLITSLITIVTEQVFKETVKTLITKQQQEIERLSEKVKKG